MATAVPSRFAVLSIEDDDFKPKKTQKSTTSSKVNTKNKGDKPKQQQQPQQQQQQQANKKKQNKVRRPLLHFCFRLAGGTSRAGCDHRGGKPSRFKFFHVDILNAMYCVSPFFLFSFQGKKKKSNNDDQQWEQWKRKDTMVKI